MSWFSKGKHTSVIGLKYVDQKINTGTHLATGRLDNIIARHTQPPIHNSIPAIAQRLNYDVLSYIFILSSSNWRQAPFTLSSVCRRWRHIALSVPRLWSRIYFGTSSHPKYIKILLTRSDSLPLHVSIPSLPKDKQLKALSPATDKIICMKILDGYKILLNQFPLLERLEIRGVYWNDRDYQYLSKPSQFPLLRELCIVEASEPMLRAIVAQATGFTGLQKLEIKCDHHAHWPKIIQRVSNTLVSLHLFMWRRDPGIYQFVFPQLRHLQIPRYNGGGGHVYLDLDAPHLESIDYEEDLAGGVYSGIRLRDPQSVKYLRTGRYPIGLDSYPQLKKLWIQNVTMPSSDMAFHLKSQIDYCPELKEIMYFDYIQYRKRRRGGTNSHLPGLAFSEVYDAIYATGREISAREFIPFEVNLPGSMPRCNECSET